MTFRLHSYQFLKNPSSMSKDIAFAISFARHGGKSLIPLNKNKTFAPTEKLLTPQLYKFNTIRKYLPCHSQWYKFLHNPLRITKDIAFNNPVCSSWRSAFKTPVNSKKTFAPSEKLFTPQLYKFNTIRKYLPCRLYWYQFLHNPLCITKDISFVNSVCSSWRCAFKTPVNNKKTFAHSVKLFTPQLHKFSTIGKYLPCRLQWYKFLYNPLHITKDIAFVNSVSL